MHAYQMPNKNLIARLYCIVQWSIERWTLNLGVDICPHTEQEYQSLHISIDDSKVEEVLTFRVNLFWDVEGGWGGKEYE